jgi:serine/threonine protein kinase
VYDALLNSSLSYNVQMSALVALRSGWHWQVHTMHRTCSQRAVSLHYIFLHINCLLPLLAALQVADFGLSHASSSSSSSSDSSASDLSSIPVRWAAPEVLTQQAWSTASDVWAFGVVLWEIFSNGSEPYATQSDQEVGAAIHDACVYAVLYVMAVQSVCLAGALEAARRVLASCGLYSRTSALPQQVHTNAVQQIPLRM